MLASYLHFLITEHQTAIKKNALVTSAKRITHIDRKFCNGGGKNQVKSMFILMFSKKMAADKTEISGLHFTYIF